MPEVHLMKDKNAGTSSLASTGIAGTWRQDWLVGHEKHSPMSSLCHWLLPVDNLAGGLYLYVTHFTTGTTTLLKKRNDRFFLFFMSCAPSNSNIKVQTRKDYWNIDLTSASKTCILIFRSQDWFFFEKLINATKNYKFEVQVLRRKKRNLWFLLFRKQVNVLTL